MTDAREEAGLEAVLAKLHDALLAADFPALARLSPALELALAGLSPKADRGMLERVERKAQRVAACAEAARNGVHAARRRIEEARDARSGLVTYDRHGLRQGLRAGDGLSRRV